MSVGSWPYLREQCPCCRYFLGYDPARLDDAGFEVRGFCRHPRIVMELFVSAQRPDLAEGSCPLFIRAPVGPGSLGNMTPER